MKILRLLLLFIMPLALQAQYNMHYINGTFYQQANQMEMTWRLTGGIRIDSMLVFRTEIKSAKYTAVPVKITVSNRSDSLFYRITDSTAKKFSAYHYFLKVRNAGTKQFNNTDTVFLAALDYIEMPLPEQILAQAGTGGKNIRISWEMKNALLVKTMTLYRSTNSVDGFKPVATLPLDRTEYIDETVQPAKPYFYHFALEYKTQQRIKRGPSFAASFMDSDKPEKATGIKAEGTQDGVQLSWNYSGQNSNGFQLYRGTADQPMQLISGMIPAVDSISQYTYADTDSLLNGAKEYHYALKTLSTSHVESDLSDTVLARPLKNIPIPKAPLNLTADKDEGKIYLFWEDIEALDEFASGYALLRSKRIGGTKETYAPADTLFSSVNFYVDSLAEPGETYRYSVVTRSVLGVQSKPSVYAAAALALTRAAAPGSLMGIAGKMGTELNWQLPGNGASMTYAVYRYEREKKATRIGLTAKGATSYVDKTAVRGKHYFYFIRSLKENKTESGNSNETGIIY